MTNGDLVENDEVSPATAIVMGDDKVDHQKEVQEEPLSEMHSSNNNEENHNVDHKGVQESSYDRTILNNNEENHNLFHDTVEVLDDQTTDILEYKPKEVQSSILNEEKHNLQHGKVDGMDDQTTMIQEKNEVKPSNINEGIHNLHSGKKEGLDVQTTETVELKPEKVQYLKMIEETNNDHHGKVESSDDQSIDTPGLKPENEEDIDHDEDRKVDPAFHNWGLKPENEEEIDQVEEEVHLGKIIEEKHNVHHEEVEGSDYWTNDIRRLKPENEEIDQVEEEVVDPVFDGTETPDVEIARNSPTLSLDLDPEAQGSGWPEKAVSIKNYVKEKSTVAVSSVLRRLSGKKDEDGQNLSECQGKNDNLTSSLKDEEDTNPDCEPKEASQKVVDRSMWNPLSYVRITRDVDSENTVDQGEVIYTEHPLPTPVLKGRIILYTKLGCQECREVRLFLHQRKLRYVEINIDVYPSRKSELERYTGSSVVPVVLFNELPIGGLSRLIDMDESGELKEKITVVMSEETSPKAPLPPLSGEDDECCSGPVDELATIVKKMRDSILVKDRFYRMRRYSNCFLGSDAVDFLMQDQDLQREQATEFGRKLVIKHFFRHVLDENVFEDGNYLYRFLDHDPVVMSQCYNIPRGIIDAKPKSLTDISSRLRFLCLAIFEAYASEDGKHVDYRSIHGSEEFARYLRVVEELQRVEMHDLSREEKLVFFINLYNMMAIHAILIWGYPTGALERRKMLGDFKYVIGGNTYSLSAIQNGILRGNQRPPYNLIKPFGVKDLRSKIALPYPEPLIHFALVSGTRSGPPLRCFSLGNIDKELMEAARDFLRNGGVIFNPEAKVASINKILRWYSVDFGKNDIEVLKHAANYLEPEKSEELLELVAGTQLKVVYQPYDWGLNY